ncbi:hypothetical protein BDW74DRAFT_170180 [Aspergillus multicolor]|uniref:uncharacterized protein n=1 Tax=Aspergillus multicolor TaxID=41759 RepID=UPI003CCE0AB8
MSSRTPIYYRRNRRAVNCEECRRAKLRCDRQHPCGACKRRKREASCSYEIRSMPTTPGNAPLGQSSISSSSQQPDLVGSESSSHCETVLERPGPEQEDAHDALSPLSINPRLSPQEIIDSLPPKSCCDYLLSHFFRIIAPLFPILHGPTFQKQYTTFMQRPHEVDLHWLALLFALCSLSLNTLDENDSRLAGSWTSLPSSPTQAPATLSLSRRLLRTAMTCLLQDEFFIWMALNIGIALRCNVASPNPNPIDTERRRRCWAGLLTLHTYQAVLFRDVDMSYLLSIKTVPPADVDDSDVTEQGITQRPHHTEPTHMSVIMAKLRLFRLSTQICRHISSPLRLDQSLLQEFDAAIAAEQKQWDATYIPDGSPNILGSNSYAYWCALQTYAHHLYLLLHRPFAHPKAPCFRSASRQRCIDSSMALISIHRQLYEAPILRNYTWLLSGVISLKALHAAVALSSCLQDLPPDVDQDTDPGYDLHSLRREVEGLVGRMHDLSRKSNICLRAYRILRRLHMAQAETENPPTENTDTPFGDPFDNLTDIREWMDSDLINWNFDGPLGVFGD